MGYYLSSVSWLRKGKVLGHQRECHRRPVPGYFRNDRKEFHPQKQSLLFGTNPEEASSIQFGWALNSSKYMWFLVEGQN